MDGTRSYDHPSDVYFVHLLRQLRDSSESPDAPQPERRTEGGGGAARLGWLELLDGGGRPYFYNFAASAAQTQPPPPEQVLLVLPLFVEGRLGWLLLLTAVPAFPPPQYPSPPPQYPSAPPQYPSPPLQ